MDSLLGKLVAESLGDETDIQSNQNFWKWAPTWGLTPEDDTLHRIINRDVVRRAKAVVPNVDSQSLAAHLRLKARRQRQARNV
jgi:hypothetical protein